MGLTPAPSGRSEKRAARFSRGFLGSFEAFWVVAHGVRISWILGLGKGELFTPELLSKTLRLAQVFGRDGRVSDQNKSRKARCALFALITVGSLKPFEGFICLLPVAAHSP